MAVSQWVIDMSNNLKKHKAEMARIEGVISNLKSKQQEYKNLALDSKNKLEYNDSQVAKIIKETSSINLGQENDSAEVLKEKEKKKNRLGGITKADML